MVENATALRADKLVIDIPGRAPGTALDFSVNGGEIWGVLGPNGAGKTTLLHTLAGLRKPRSGGVMLNGSAIAKLRRRQVARSLAVIFQERQDGFPGTVMETAMIGRHPFLAPWDVETANDIATARRALAQVELSDFEGRLVSTLSGGERQRLAIATALCQQPTVLLADEPSNHLDLHHQVEVMNIIRRQADDGCAVLLCLHDLNLAARCCDNILLLFPDGSACWGPAPIMLKTSALEKLYGTPLTAIENNGQRFFIPSDGGPGA